jgi:hypothetical protein
VEAGELDELRVKGILGNDVIYSQRDSLTGNWVIRAIPVDDDNAAPTTIYDAPEYPWANIRGGALVWWTIYAPATSDVLMVWTRASGVVSMGKTAARASEVFASADGSKIAFPETRSGASVQVRVRNIADGNGSTLLTGEDAVDMNDTQCRVSMSFVGSTFFAELCPVANPSAAKLVMVRSDGERVRLDAPDGHPPTLRPGPAWGSDDCPGCRSAFVVDRTGSKVFVRRADSSGAIIHVDGGAPTLDVIPDVAEGVLLSDGSALVYRTAANVLKKVATGNLSVTTIAQAAKGILGVTPDDKTVLFHTLAVGDWVDVNAVDHTGATPAVTIAPTATALRWGVWQVTPDSSHLLFFEGGNCVLPKSVPLHGGPMTPLGEIDWGTAGFEFARSGIVNVPGAPMGGNGLAYADFVYGARFPLPNVAEAGGSAVHGNRLFYGGRSPAGLYVTELP